MLASARGGDLLSERKRRESAVRVKLKSRMASLSAFTVKRRRHHKDAILALAAELPDDAFEVKVAAAKERAGTAEARGRRKDRWQGLLPTASG